MQKMLIDTFVVPEASQGTFLEITHWLQALMRTLPGFVAGSLCVKEDGTGHHHYLRTAVWADEAAVENAIQSMTAEFQRRGIDPLETRKRLHVETDRAIYEYVPF